MASFYRSGSWGRVTGSGTLRLRDALTGQKQSGDFTSWFPKTCVPCSILRQKSWCIYVCDKTFPEEMKHTHLVTPDREPMTVQRTDTPKVFQLGKPMSFTRVTYKNMRERLLTGAEITQRQMHHQSSPQHEWQLTGAGAHCIVYRKSTGKSVFSSLLGCSGDLRIAFVSWLVWENQLLMWLAKEELSESSQFQGLLKLLCRLLPELKKFLYRMKNFIPFRTSGVLNNFSPKQNALF